MKEYKINLKEGWKVWRLALAFPLLLLGEFLKDVGESISGVDF